MRETTIAVRDYMVDVALARGDIADQALGRSCHASG